MSPRAAAWLAWSLWAISLALIVFGGLLDTLTPPVPVRGASPPGSAVLFRALLLAFPTVGALVASRRPENPIGWIFCGGGLVNVVQDFALRYADYTLYAQHGALPGGRYMAWISSWVGSPSLMVLAVLLFLLFPNGRLPSRRWRPVVWMAVGGGVIVALAVALRPGALDTHSIANPLGFGGGIGGVLQVLGNVGGALVPVSLLASVTSLILRLRGARGDERQQLKWFVYAAALMVGGVAGSLVFSTGRASSIAWFMTILGFMVLPICTGIAILKYRLYDIDRIINRTLVYGALTATLVLVYLGGVVMLQGAFRAFTGGDSTLAVVASTLAIAALFGPLRRRIQAFIDRRFYRKKYDAAKTLATFSARLRDETDLEELGEDLIDVVREAVQPDRVSLWLRRPEEDR
ncbi:MAG: hypothetical protein M3Q49_11925 [Actinomycetota bacterium]|nr:hypothetical protein [Actinomycetota bacterium]